MINIYITYILIFMGNNCCKPFKNEANETIHGN